MKGLTHFMSGMAVASFFVPAVKMAASTKLGIPLSEASMILTLAGLYGIMPDTLDFKFGQFFSVPDIEVDCDPNNPDPQKMAEQLGHAMEKSYLEKRLIKAQLYPMRLGVNFWRQYVIKFDMKTNEVIIIMNEIVSTSQVAFPGTEPKENRIGRYRLKHGKIMETHGRPSVVDILSGPQYGFKSDGENIIIEFLPWHRTWSHSYVLGLFLSVPVFLIAFLFNFTLWWMYGLIAFLGFATHLTEDLTGHMGGSLIWPFYKERTNGLCLFKASNPHMNFSIDYAAVVIVIYNLWRITPPNIKGVPITPMNPFLYFFLFLVIPLGIYFGIKTYFSEGTKKKKEGEISAERALQLEEQTKYDELAFEDESSIAG